MMLRKLFNEYKLEYIVALFDLFGRTFCDDLVLGCGVNCVLMFDELTKQIPTTHTTCETLNVPILTSERYEADNVIGTLTEKASTAGFQVAIVTRDKDFFQLVHDGIRVFNPHNENTWYDTKNIKNKFNIP